MKLQGIDGNLELAVVIVNYRTPELVIQCLSSLMPELVGLSAKAVVVDNDSNDGSFSALSKAVSDFDHEYRSKILLIESSFNGGFSAGNNIGIRAVEASSYMLLNSDTLVRPGSIDKLLSTLSANPHVGMLSPRLEYSGGKPQESCFRFHSVLSELIRGAQLSLLTRMLEGSVVALEVDDVETPIEWTSFACVLIRAEILEKLGLLDDGYFMYFEDVEFCSRVKSRGWEIANEPAAKVVHLRGGSSPVKANTAMRKRLPKYYYESRARYFYQKGGWLYLLMANLAWSLGRLLCKLKVLAGRNDESAIEAEWRDIWTNFGYPLAPYTHPSK